MEVWPACKRLAFAALAAYFVFIVAKSAEKLAARRVATSTKVAYSGRIRFPSVSICMLTSKGFGSGQLVGESLSLLAEPFNLSMILHSLKYTEGRTYVRH